jgi:outer membrane receptor protein involved in Fe transport
VVPPICQIQWTQNLGKAVAKGFDVSADFDLGAGLSLESSLGYTDAQYTKEAFIGASGPGQTPVVAEGDAIVGENGTVTPPWTATIGPQYKFTAFDHPSFIRLDYEWSSGEKWTPASRDSRTGQYDAAFSSNTLPTLTLPLFSQHLLSFRAGTTIDHAQVSVFADNLTNSHQLINASHEIVTFDPNTGAPLASPLYRNISNRPLTFGLTVVFKY